MDIRYKNKREGKKTVEVGDFIVFTNNNGDRTLRQIGSVCGEYVGIYPDGTSGYVANSPEGLFNRYCSEYKNAILVKRERVTLEVDLAE